MVVKNFLTDNNRRGSVRLNMDELATLVSQAIEQQGLSYRKAGDLWGINPQHLNQVATGKIKRPSPEMLMAIARGSGIPYRRLVLAAYGLTYDSPAGVPA